MIFLYSRELNENMCNLLSSSEVEIKIIIKITPLHSRIRYIFSRFTSEYDIFIERYQRIAISYLKMEIVNTSLHRSGLNPAEPASPGISPAAGRQPAGTFGPDKMPDPATPGTVRLPDCMYVPY